MIPLTQIVLERTGMVINLAQEQQIRMLLNGIANISGPDGSEEVILALKYEPLSHPLWCAVIRRITGASEVHS